MFVVLDTNIFFRDFLLQGKNFQILLESLPQVPARLCVPEIVIDEVCAKYREAVSEHVSAVESANHKLRALLREDLGLVAPVLPTDRLSERYRDYLRTRLSEAGVKFLAYPKEPHERVVRHALERNKPFNKKGGGYRDYLIWISIRSEMYFAPEESVALVTANTRDFCDRQELAASLVAEVARFHHAGVPVLVYPSLEAFNEAHVLPTLRRHERLRQEIEEGMGTDFDLGSWAASELFELLRWDDEILLASYGLESHHASAHLIALDQIQDLEVTDVRELSDERRLVAARAQVAAVLSLDVSWDQYVGSTETRELLGGGAGEFSSASWNERVEFEVGFSLILDSATSNVVTAEIDSMQRL